MLDEYQEDFVTNLEDQIEYTQPQEQLRPQASAKQFTPQRQYRYQAYEQPDVELPQKKQEDINELLTERGMGINFLKSFMLGMVSIMIIVSSFYVSFTIGKKVFISQKNQVIKSDIPFSVNTSSAELSALEKELGPSLNNKIIGSQFDEARRIKQAMQQPVHVATTKIQPAAIKKPIHTQSVLSAQKKIYKVIAGTFTDSEYAHVAADKLTDAGFQTLIYRNQDNMFRVQVGAYSSKENAQSALSKAVSQGYPAFLALN